MHLFGKVEHWLETTATLCGITPNTHSPSRDPEEDVAVILEDRDRQLPHLVVTHRAVGQLHVDVPRWVSHDHREFTQHRHLKVAQVTLDPLSTGGWIVRLNLY